MKVTSFGHIGVALLLSGAVTLAAPPSLGADAANPPTTGAVASPSLADTDLSGEWEVQIGAPTGAYASKLVLEKDGDGYKGTFTGADGGQSFTLNGTPQGDRIDFKSADGDQTYPARLVDGLLKGTYTQDGAEQSWTARRPRASPAHSAIAGRWKVTMDGPNGNTFEREMTVSADGPSFSGVLKAPTNLPPPAAGNGNGGGNFRRDIAFKDATFANNEFSFTTEFDRNGTTVRRTYRATLKGDALDGTIEGGQTPRHWKAVRIADTSGLTGTWTMTTQGRNGNATSRDLILTQDGEKVTGTLKAAPRPTGADNGTVNGGNGNGGNGFRSRDVEITDGSFRNGELTFTTSYTTGGGNTRTRTFHAKLNGDTLEGTVEGGNGGGNGQGGNGQAAQGPRTWKAVRSGGAVGGTQRAAGDLTGEWDVAIQTTAQTYTAVVTLKQDGGNWGGEYVTKGPDNAELKTPVQGFSSDGGKVKFSVDLPIQLQGRTSLHIDFSGDRDGDTIKGNETSTFGTSTFTMKRKGAGSALAPTAEK